jgi:glutamate N-acetyltransferase/amino-acid N-acetyltransferase
MTTDTVSKHAATRVWIDGRAVTIAGIAKGVGMIEPNMATMLAFVLTDAAATPAFLRAALREAATRASTG